MSYSLGDLEYARREVAAIEERIAAARTRVALIERTGRDTKDARVLLGQMEKARRSCIERLGAIRQAIGPSAY